MGNNTEVNLHSFKRKKLTRIPIIIVFGDHVATEKSDNFNSEVWRVAKKRARQFVETINRHGGDATLLVLPEIGIQGNTHAAFADFNNLEVADLLEQFLQAKGLDGYENPHAGPKITKASKQLSKSTPSL